MRRNSSAISPLAAACERAELYFAAYPGSPAAARRPKLFRRSGTWVALLGANVRDGIAGFGLTIEAALRAFDVQYLATLRPPVSNGRIKNNPSPSEKASEYGRRSGNLST
jgi:hypothetical protein